MASHPVIAHMATVRERGVFLEMVIGSLLHQVDQLRLYCNDFVGFIPDVLRHEKLVVYDAPSGDLGDRGKFYKHEPDAYNLTCDDDLVYREDYVPTLLRGIKRYGGIVTLHGKVLPRRKLHSYYRDKDIMHYHCLAHNVTERQVDVPGTGVMGYLAADGFVLRHTMMPVANMADIWTAIAARQQGVHIHVLAHTVGMVAQCPIYRSIFANRFWQDEEETFFVNKYLQPG